MDRLTANFAAWARRTEAPTWLLIIIIYSGWLALTFYWNALPPWAVVPLGAWLCAWHMSLQHELLHGHPTRSQRLNAALGTPPLSLWLPYALYRDLHIRHHIDDHLTDPLQDPESTYMAAATWHQAGALHRALQCACATLAGRMLLGPARAMWLLWSQQARPAGRDGAALGLWISHAAAVGAVLIWVCGVCRIDFFAYLACFVYPGTALGMIRSLAEHRAAARPEDRTAVVEHAPVLALLFLNNNLHILHHEQPAIAWYRLPAEWRLARGRLLAARHGPIYNGYKDVAARYTFRPHHGGPLPSAAELRRENAAVHAAAHAPQGQKIDGPMTIPDSLLPALHASLM